MGLTSGLGSEVAAGLVADGADFERVRAQSTRGPAATIWRSMTARVKDGKAGLVETALAAAVERRSDWAERAVDRALELARLPVTGWVHSDAGCLSLSGGHHAVELSLAIDWLWPVLGRDRREALLQGLIALGVENLTRCPAGVRDPGDGRGRLLLVRRLDKDDPCCLHPVFEQVNNWDIWFGTGLLLAARLTRRAYLQPDAGWPALEWGSFHDTGYVLDEARVGRWESIACERLTTALASQLGPDGDYAEGVNYAGYASDALVVSMLAMLRSGRLAKLPEGVANMPRWVWNQYMAGWGSPASNFNDGVLPGRASLALYALAAAETRDGLTQAIVFDALERGVGEVDGMLALTLRQDVPVNELIRPRAAHYRHTGTVTWRGGPAGRDVFFSLKSGAHGGAHQHRDRNSFFVWAYGEPLIVDTGDCRYGGADYGAHFFETAAHNCVLVDGRGQVGDNTKPLAGKIVEHEARTHGPNSPECGEDETVSRLVAEAGGCYEGVESCERRVVYIRPGIVVMRDAVRGRCDDLTWLAHGYNADGASRWELHSQHARLVRPTASLDVFFMESPTTLSVTAGSLDGKPGGTLRLAASVHGKAVTTVLVVSRAGAAKPGVVRNADGSMTVSAESLTVTLDHNGRELRLVPATQKPGVLPAVVPSVTVAL